MTNGKFILSVFITLVMACLIVGMIVGFVHSLLVIGIYATLFYIGMKISSSANAVLGANYNREAALVYDIILITVSCICFGIFIGLIMQ